MSHAENNFINAVHTSSFESEIEERNQTFGTFERETLGPDKFLPDELFKNDRVGQPGQDPNLLFVTQADAVAGALHTFLKPVTHEAVVDVHELHTDGSAVRIPEPFKDLTQRDPASAAHCLTSEEAIHIGFRQTVKIEIELWRCCAWNSQRIELSGHMSANTIISNELVNTFLKNRSCGFFCNSAIPSCCRRIKDAPGLERRCKPFGLGEPVALRKALKISPPILADRFGIPQVILVKRF